jgi:hypothetical protein
MAGGSLTITADTYYKLTAVAESVLCWTSAANDRNVVTQHGVNGAPFSIRIPEESFGGGSLILKRGGTDLVAGYVPGTHVVVDAANGQGISLNANTCPARTPQPTTTGTPVVVSNVRTIALTYANAAGAGTVNIFWGDGTSTLGAAESGTSNHTYPDVGTWNVSVVDATDGTAVASFVIKL